MFATLSLFVRPLALVDLLLWKFRAAGIEADAATTKETLELLEQFLWFLVVVFFMAIFWIVARHYVNVSTKKRLGTSKAHLFSLGVAIGASTVVAFWKLVHYSAENRDQETLTSSGFRFGEILGLLLGGGLVWGGTQMMHRDSTLEYDASAIQFGSCLRFRNRLRIFARILRHIFREKKTQRIFIFLVINLVFTFVEFVVGIISNSLGLISDAGHMMFDCSALGIGLFAAYVSTWRPDSRFTYGYGRAEVLSGFANAIILLFIAVSVITEAIQV